MENYTLDQQTICGEDFLNTIQETFGRQNRGSHLSCGIMKLTQASETRAAESLASRKMEKHWGNSSEESRIAFYETKGVGV